MDFGGFKTYLTQEQLGEIKKLYDCALQAPNKREASVYINRILYVAPGLGGYANNVLHELVAALKDASGRVRDKEEKMQRCFECLYKLEWCVRSR